MLASQKLQRLGFNPTRRCLLPVVCRDLLIRPPGHGMDLYSVLDFRDKLHGLIGFLHRTLYTSFDRMGLPGKLKLILDQRLTEVGLRRIMRDTKTGRTFRILRSVFKETGMTGEDKTHWIFFLPHVLGHRAMCLPEQLREPVLTALTTAQLMVIASRGLRSYRRSELELVFDRGYVCLFTNMERIFQINHDRQYKEKFDKHRRNPRKYAAPKRFCRQDR